MTVGSSEAEVDGERIDMGAELLKPSPRPFIFVPARFVIEQLGGTVSWEEETNTLVIEIVQ